MDLGEMKRIGILGGMSPESTALYYEHITRTYTAQYGDYGYPEILIYTALLHAEKALRLATQPER
jgi:aspartate racemase